MLLDPHLENLIHKKKPATKEEIFFALKALRIVPSITMLDPPIDKALPYSKKILAITDHLAIVLVCWAPSMFSAPHDHGMSYGCYKVIQGSISNLFWEMNHEKLTALEPVALDVGHIQYVRVGEIHSMHNVLTIPSYSLHIYVKPITSMKVYDPVSSQSRIVPKHHGAWWPKEKDSIFEESYVE